MFFLEIYYNELPHIYLILSFHSLGLGSCNFPKDFAIIIETVASPVTFTVVLHMSKGLSTAKIKAKPIGSNSSGKPIDSNTITYITIPALGTAALPIDANKAVATMTI